MYVIRCHIILHLYLITIDKHEHCFIFWNKSQSRFIPTRNIPSIFSKTFTIHDSFLHFLLCLLISDEKIKDTCYAYFTRMNIFFKSQECLLSIPLLKKYFLSLLIFYRHCFRTYQRWLLQCKQVRGMCENCCQCAFVFSILSTAEHNSFLSFYLKLTILICLPYSIDYIFFLYFLLVEAFFLFQSFCVLLWFSDIFDLCSVDRFIWCRLSCMWPLWAGKQCFESMLQESLDFPSRGIFHLI